MLLRAQEVQQSWGAWKKEPEGRDSRQAIRFSEEQWATGEEEGMTFKCDCIVNRV